MPLSPTDANISAVTVTEGGGDARLRWASTDPPQAVFQVYIDGIRVWSGTAKSVLLPLPARAPGQRHRVNILAVDPSDAGTDFSGLLDPPAGGGDRATLFWYGGRFLDSGLVRF